GPRRRGARGDRRMGLGVVPGAAGGAHRACGCPPRRLTLPLAPRAGTTAHGPAATIEQARRSRRTGG
ncbi:antimicrobial peptide ABC transporter permease, partial [Microbacterium sp. HM58-2]